MENLLKTISVQKLPTLAKESIYSGVKKEAGVYIPLRNTLVCTIQAQLDATAEEMISLLGKGNRKHRSRLQSDGGYHRQSAHHSGSLGQDHFCPACGVRQSCQEGDNLAAVATIRHNDQFRQLY